MHSTSPVNIAKAPPSHFVEFNKAHPYPRFEMKKERMRLLQEYFHLSADDTQAFYSSYVKWLDNLDAWARNPLDPALLLHRDWNDGVTATLMEIALQIGGEKDLGSYDGKIKICVEVGSQSKTDYWEVDGAHMGDAADYNSPFLWNDVDLSVPCESESSTAGDALTHTSTPPKKVSERPSYMPRPPRTASQSPPYTYAPRPTSTSPKTVSQPSSYMYAPRPTPTLPEYIGTNKLIHLGQIKAYRVAETSDSKHPELEECHVYYSAVAKLRDTDGTIDGIFSFPIQEPCPLPFDPIWGPSADGIFYLGRNFEDAEMRGRWTLCQRLTENEIVDVVRPRKVDGGHPGYPERSWIRRGFGFEEMGFENVEAARQ
jgi:hypothetical protein